MKCLRFGLVVAFVIGTIAVSPAQTAEPKQQDENIQGLPRGRDLSDKEYEVLDRQLKGASQQKVLRLLGVPSSNRRLGGKVVLWRYTWSKGDITVYLRNGVVEETGHNERQTGNDTNDLFNP